MSELEQGREDDRGNDNGKIVTVNVNGEPEQIAKGEYTVAQLKKEFGIDSNRVLAEEINGVLTDLADNDKVKIKRKEVFASHVGRGGSS